MSSFKLDEDLRKAELELRKIEESHSRNFGRSDKSVVNHLEEKRNKQRAKVDALRRKQAEFGRERKLRKDKEKFRFF